MNVREILDYDPETGILRWKYRPDRPKQWNSYWPGRQAGTPHHKDGIQVNLGGRLYRAHVLIFMWMGRTRHKGMVVDHRDGNRANNRWDNLRLATPAQNAQNSRARGKWPKGVYSPRPGQFVAQIKYDGINHYLGSFKTPAEAHQAYKIEAERVFGEFACTGR